MSHARKLGRRRERLLLAAVAVIVLLSVQGGLQRLGVPVLWVPPMGAASHGPLFVVGVFASLIALERAVALQVAWAYLVPASSLAGAVGLLFGWVGSAWLMVGATVGLFIVNVAIAKRQSEPFTWIMALGSAALVLGTVAWASGRPVAAVVPSWMVFFVLTISAERLELSRLRPTPTWARRLHWALSAAVAVCSVALLLSPALVMPLGVCFFLLGLWQLQFDLARATSGLPGLAGYSAKGVLLGAGWLLVSGSLLVIFGLPPAGPHYDAILHGVLVGYVFSMVFAHAPIILPAVAGIRVGFTPLMYVPLALLQLSVAGRIVGDLAASHTLRVAGSLASVVALALFAATMVASALRQTRIQSPVSAPEFSRSH